MHDTTHQIGKEVTYTYDAEGRRRTMVQRVNTTRYTIDPNGKLSRLLVKHNPDSTKTYYVYGYGLLYEANKPGAAAETSITHHYDQVGSTILRTDDTGNDVGRAEYSPYGQIIWQTGNMATPFLYNGKFGVMTDANGLLHMRARFYSPYLMRFLNPDPIGFSGGMNWFAYANGNPIMQMDPLGLVGSGLTITNSGWVNGWTGETGTYTGTNQINGPISGLANFLFRFGDAEIGPAVTGNLSRLLSQMPETSVPRNVNLGDFENVKAADWIDVGLTLGDFRYTRTDDRVEVSDVYDFPWSQSDWQGGEVHHNAPLSVLIGWAGKAFNVNASIQVPSNQTAASPVHSGK